MDANLRAAQRLLGRTLQGRVRGEVERERIWADVDQLLRAFGDELGVQPPATVSLLVMALQQEREV